LTAIIFCGFALFCASPLSAQGGPDSIYIPGKGYVEPWQASGVKPARHFGGYTKKSKRKTKVAGRSFTPSASVSFYSSAAPWLEEARRYVGKGNPTSRRSLWCARFINDRLARAGKRGTGSDMAKSFLKLPRTSARPGAIAVYNRGRNPKNGHAAIVEKVEGGRVTLISPNCRGGVCRYSKPIGSAVAYVWPS
jgi:uncharacterized protein (TIGR02594 family)